MRRAKGVNTRNIPVLKIKNLEVNFVHKIGFHFSASSIRVPSRISKHERRLDVSHDLKT